MKFIQVLTSCEIPRISQLLFKNLKYIQDSKKTHFLANANLWMTFWKYLIFSNKLLGKCQNIEDILDKYILNIISQYN